MFVGRHHVDLEMLMSVPLMPTFFLLMGICVADAVVLAEHFRSLRGDDKGDDRYLSERYYYMYILRAMTGTYRNDIIIYIY